MFRKWISRPVRVQYEFVSNQNIRTFTAAIFHNISIKLSIFVFIYCMNIGNNRKIEENAKTIA